MAWYEKFENNENIYVEQNIFDKNELESFEAVYEINGEKKTSVLYYYEDNNIRFYALGFLESLKGDNLIVLESDLSDVLKFKTAKTRRKHLSEIIKKNERDLLYK